nr:MAG TPA: hypothetical protein [Herelleviridae sp.]DAV56924.1 MAG TPA: hypothetical protein [Caudoviricetes sp.]
MYIITFVTHCQRIFKYFYVDNVIIKCYTFIIK